MSEHSEVLKLILKSEGGLNEAESPEVGGVSYAGITQQAYDEFRRATHPTSAPYIISTGNTPASVRDLADRHDIIEAFYDWYFGKYHTWELPEFMQYIYADFVTNGASAAVKIIQRMVGVDDDGIWGSGTSRIVAEWKTRVEAELENDPHVDNNLITEFHEQKLAHYNYLAEKNPAKYAEYLPGWKRRANNVISDLGHYFENDEPTPKAIDEDDPILEQLTEEPTQPQEDTPVTRGEFDELKGMVSDILQKLDPNAAKQGFFK